MKILIVGGTGTIGKSIVDRLQARHELIIASHSNADVTVDIANEQSIKDMYQRIGKVDAVVSAAGKVHFAELQEFNTELFSIGLQNKLMGQVNLVMHGLNYLNNHGSFTLTSGLLNHDPIRYGASAGMVNGGLEGFVRSSAIEMPRGIRINIVSPTVITEAMPAYEAYFRGYQPVDASVAALAYEKSIEGLQTGQVYNVGW